MKSSSSISTTFYDITCKGFQYDLTSYFENFEKKRSSQLLQVSLKTKATYSKAKVQKKFIGIFGIQNQELYYCSFFDKAPTFVLNYLWLLRLRNRSFISVLFTIMLTYLKNLPSFPIKADLSLDSKNQNKTCTSKVRLSSLPIGT